MRGMRASLEGVLQEKAQGFCGVDGRRGHIQYIPTVLFMSFWSNCHHEEYCTVLTTEKIMKDRRQWFVAKWGMAQIPPSNWLRIWTSMAQKVASRTQWDYLRCSWQLNCVKDSNIQRYELEISYIEKDSIHSCSDLRALMGGVSTFRVVIPTLPREPRSCLDTT